MTHPAADSAPMIRIVFVDDEINILQAMRRTMHSMRGEWAMEFLSSGAEALESLARLPASVIVSDMRMPGMDGWQLLTEVKNRYPQTVRLVLSGHSDPCSIMGAVGVAHQYLAKPCETETLKAAIAQTRVLREMLNSDRLAQLVGRVDMLPSAPKAFQEILTCLQQPSPSVADAAKIIGRDTAMTANVIKLVNSAFFGSRQPIRTAERAVAYLGLDTLGALVLGHSTFKTGATTLAGFSLERLWQHSLDTALAARTVALCEKWSNAQAEEAFLAGILHDVGKIVFATRPATAAVEIDPNGDVCEQMALHHAEVGAYLLGLWGFPNPIIEAVAFHHTPSLAPGAGLRLPGLIHIANLLAHRQDGPSGKIADAADVQGQFSELEALGLAARWPEWVAAMDTLGAERTVA